MRAALYVRVSTDDQAKEGFSIEAQKRRLLAFCESQDWSIADLYIDDGYSAKDMERPHMKRMLRDMTNDVFDVVLVYKLDRLTRSAADCDHLIKTFEAHKIAFQSCTESFETRTATGRLFIRLIADIAQWERENIGERVRMGQEQKVLEGKKPGGKYPYGYDSNGDSIPEEFDNLRRLRDLYMKDNLGFKTIAITMNREGRLRRGFDWRSSTVALTLENPFYAGIIQFGSKMADGKYPQRKRELRTEVVRSMGSHETVWTVEEYEEHLRLMRKRTDGGYSRKLDYWYSGILRCGQCGQAMYGRLTNKKKADGTVVRRPYYICGQRKENDKCNMPIMRQKHIEHMLLTYIEDMRSDRSLTTAEQLRIKKEQSNRQKEIQKLKRELESIKERIKKWQYMFVEGLIVAEDLRARLAGESNRETEIKEQLEEFQMQDQETPIIQSQLFNMADNWDLFSDMEKKELLALIFEEIRVFTNEVKPKGVKNKFFDASIKVKYR